MIRRLMHRCRAGCCCLPCLYGSVQDRQGEGGCALNCCIYYLLSHFYLCCSECFGVLGVPLHSPLGLCSRSCGYHIKGPVGKAGCADGSCMSELPHGLGAVVHNQARRALRSKYNLAPSGNDCCVVTFWYSPCAMCCCARLVSYLDLLTHPSNGTVG